MSSKFIYLGIAALAGITMAFQGSINSKLGKVVGLWEATFIVHVVGLLTTVLILFGLRMGSGSLRDTPDAPWYSLLGGVLGVLIVYGVVTSIPKVGVAAATTSIIVGQVLTALFIDHFGMFGLTKIPFTWIKIVGVGLLAIGARLILG